METTALRSAYERLLEAAATPDLGDAADGGWNADQILRFSQQDRNGRS